LADSFSAPGVLRGAVVLIVQCAQRLLVEERLYAVSVCILRQGPGWRDQYFLFIIDDN
jgi:hypothetical protein